MKTPAPRPSHSQDGSVVVIAISLIAMIAAMVGVGSLLNSNILRNADRSQQYLAASALADGALESLYAQWKPLSAQNPTNAAGSPPRLVDGDGNVISPPAVNGVQSGMVQLVKPTLAPVNGELRHVVMDAGTGGDVALSSGTGGSPTYLATATIRFPSSQGMVNMTASQIFRYSGQSPTDWAIIELVPERTVNWTNEDGEPVTLGGSLEIHPGATMKVDKIHTNGTLHIASNNFEQEDTITYSEGYETTSDPDENRDNSGAPGVDGESPPTQVDRVGFLDVDANDLELGVNPEDRDSNPNNDSYRELLDPSVPGHSDPLRDGTESQRPHDQAAIKIVVDGNNTLRVSKRDGTPVTFGDPLYNTILRSINPTRDLTATTLDAGNNAVLDQPNDFQTIRDGRNAADMRTTSLDVETLRIAFDGGLVDTDTGETVVPDLSTYNFGFPAGVQPADDNTRAVVDPNTASPSLPHGWNGAIHFMDTSADPTNANAGGEQHRALRLRRGGQVPTVKRMGTGGDSTYVGFTVVSPNPVYVQGDFNTGSTYADYNDTTDSSGLPAADPVVKPDSSTISHNNPLSAFDGFNHIVTGYEHDTAVAVDSNGNEAPVIPPAAVLGDAVNILSNSWDDSFSDSGIGSRDASGTTVNAAIISGVVPSGAKDNRGEFAYNRYSGGAENYPRFLEDWSGVVFCYHGSMIMAFESEQAYYGWKGTGTVYNAPKRYWFHEDGFKTITINGIPVNNPPPLLPTRVFTFPRNPKVVESFTITRN